MRRETRKKDFDCVEMMHRGALRIHETLKDMSREERLDYWRQRHVEALRELEAAREASRAAR